MQEESEEHKVNVIRDAPATAKERRNDYATRCRARACGLVSDGAIDGPRLLDGKRGCVPRTPEDNYWLSPGAADAYPRAATRRYETGARGRQVGEVRRASRSYLELVFGGLGILCVLRPRRQFATGSQDSIVGHNSTVIVAGRVAADAVGEVAADE